MYLSGDFLLHAMCWNLSGLTPDEESALLAPSWRLSRRSVGGSVSYTPRAGICLVVRLEGVSITRPVMESVSFWVVGEYLSH